MSNLEKNKQIKEVSKATHLRRKSKVCKVYELKIVENRLNLIQLNHLKMLFVEAKWIYNYVLSLQQSGIDIFKINYKNYTSIKHFNKEHIEIEETLKFLSSQMKQDLFNKPKENILKLSKLKKKNKVGKLKFKSRVNSIPLKQVKVTYNLYPEFNKIKIQGIKKSILVRGLHQIKDNYEIANANLVRKPSGYYLKVTTFQNPIEKMKMCNVIGLDFGIKDNIVDSNGIKYNWKFEESKRLKLLSKKMNRATKGSNNRNKLKDNLALSYEKQSNKKKDAKNKFVHKIITENDIICIQDENIRAWKSSKMRGFGSRIHHSMMGGIISSLKDKEETSIVDRWFPTTQLCNKCGKSSRKQSLDKRTYICKHCGFEIDRDLNSSKNILVAGLLVRFGSTNKIPMDYRKYKPVEILINTLDESLEQIKFVKQEDALIYQA